jgi:hypothetical protein
MKSEVNFSEGEVVQNFPMLFKAVDSGHVVLFTSEICGTVVFSGDSCFSVGTNTDTWKKCWHDYWEKLPPGSTVTLTQE